MIRVKFANSSASSKSPDGKLGINVVEMTTLFPRGTSAVEDVRAKSWAMKPERISMSFVWGRPRALRMARRACSKS